MLVKGAPSSLYSQLPDTTDIQFAREMTEMQSEVENTVDDCGANLRLAPVTVWSSGAALKTNLCLVKAKFTDVNRS